MFGRVSRPFYVFTLLGIPVYATGFYLLIVLYFAWTIGDPVFGAIWALAITFSILVHEYGHGLVARRLKLVPKILLHGWGGLCAHERALRDRHDVVILLCGPGAGLALGTVVLGVWVGLYGWEPRLLLAPPPTRLGYLLWALVYINVFWSLVNLVPIWPLDGGQLFRILLLQFLEPGHAERATHGVGVFLAGGATLLAMLGGSMFLVILCALLAFENFQRIQTAGTGRSGAVRSKSRYAKGLLGDAQKALVAGDFREAARVAHQARSEQNLLPEHVRAIWMVLAIATSELGGHEEALRYAERAPDVPEVARVKARSLVELGRLDEARSVMGSKAFQKLADERRRELERRVA